MARAVSPASSSSARRPAHSRQRADPDGEPGSLAQLEVEVAAGGAQGLVDAGEHPPQPAHAVRREQAEPLGLAAGAELGERALERLARSTRACASSSTRKRGSMPAANGYACSSRWQKPWIVEIQAPSSSRARSARPARRGGRGSASAARRRRARVYVITRIESTSSPRSQTARTNRSTSTAVFPVPAPARDEDDPGRLDRRGLLRVGRVHWPPHPAHRAEVAPGGAAGSPFGSCRTSPARIRSTNPPAVLGGPVDLRPERRPRRGSRSSENPGSRPRAPSPEQPAGLPLARERPVERRRAARARRGRAGRACRAGSAAAARSRSSRAEKAVLPDL